MISADHSRTQTGATPGGTSPSINRETAGTIAALLRLIRPAWDQLATLNAVHDASRTHRDLADLVAGCVRIAQDRTLQTPAMLRDDESPHWRRTATPTVTSGPSRNESCQVRGHDGYWAGNCPACRVEARIAQAEQERTEREHPPDRYGIDQ